jgi:hypothetical protein
MDSFNFVLSQLLPVLIAILIPSIGVLVIYLTKKLGANLDQKNKILLSSLLTDIATQAIVYAEQMARNYEKGEREKCSGEDKLVAAMDYAMRELKEHKLDKIAEEVIARRIEAVLGMTNSAAEEAASAISGFNPGTEESEDSDETPNNRF